MRGIVGFVGHRRRPGPVRSAPGAAGVPVQRRLYYACVLAPLVTLAIAVTALTIRRAILPPGGKDLQWSPTRLFVNGVNPYEAALHGSHEIILAQAPNYLHILYFIYWPLGLLSFDSAKIFWLSVNLILVVVLVYAIGRVASWNWWTTLSIGCVFLISTPTRFAIINGQTSLLLLAAAMVAFTYRDRVWSGVALATVIAKYSFLPIALCFLVQRRWKSISIAIAASILSWLLFIAMVHSENILGTLREPLEVSRTAVANGVGDLMSVLQLTMGLDRSNFALYWAGFIVAFILTLLIIPRLEADQWMHALAISSVISLLCFKHLLHDFVFLLPVLAILGTVTKKKKIVTICVVFSQWFGLGILDQLGVATTTATATTLSFCSMCALLWAIIPMRLVTVSRGATKDRQPSCTDHGR